MSKNEEMKRALELREEHFRESFQRAYEIQRIEDVREFANDITMRILILADLHEPENAKFWEVEKPYSHD